MKVELDVLYLKSTQTVVPTLFRRNIIRSKQVFKVKHNANGNVNKYETHLVTKSYQQEHGLNYDEVFLLVVQYNSLPLFIAISAYDN